MSNHNDDNDDQVMAAGDEFRRLAALSGNTMHWSETDAIDGDVIRSHFSAPGNATASIDPDTGANLVGVEVDTEDDDR